MADSLLEDVTELSAPAAGDLIYVCHDPAGTPVDRKLKIENNFLPIVTVSFSGTPDFDANLGHMFIITLTSNITGWTISNPQSGQKITIIFVQDGTGSRTLAGAPGTVKLAGGSFTLSITASKRDTLTLLYDGTNWNEVARSVNL